MTPRTRNLITLNVLLAVVVGVPISIVVVRMAQTPVTPLATLTESQPHE